MSRLETLYIVVDLQQRLPKQPLTIRRMDTWARLEGKLGIGYHFLIDRDGACHKGRPLWEPSACGIGWQRDAVSVAICIEGPTISPRKRETLDRLLKQLQEAYPAAQVLSKSELLGVSE